MIDYSMYENRIGLVGAGGGCRVAECLAGALKSFTEHNINIDYMWLTSGAAMTGPLYYLSDQFKKDMLSFLQAHPIDEVLIPYYDIAILIAGKPVYDNDILLDIMEGQFKGRTLDNVIVTITDAVTRETLYLPADFQTVVSTSSIPKVFRDRTLIRKLMYRRIQPQKDGEPITARTEYIDKKRVISLDGGIYNMIPVPEPEIIERLSHLYIVLPCEDTVSESIHTQSSLGQALSWIIETMERGTRTVVETWGNHPKVTILKSKPCKSSLLNWSENFKLFQHYYKYTDKVLSASKRIAIQIT